MWKTEYGFVETKNGFNCVSCGTRPWKSPRSNWVLAFSDIFWTDTKDALCDNYHIVNATVLSSNR